MTASDFTADEKNAVYKAIISRRDMRHFKAGAQVSADVLQRLLEAAHWGPSVGFMQPWRFIRITDHVLRQALHELVEQERIRTAAALGERQGEFLKLKVEGMREAAELIAVCLADKREEHVFGRRTMPHMDVASVGCAIQNMWLAARAEGLGMGWVSLFDPVAVGQVLQLPHGAETVGLMCLGAVGQFYEQPMLQQERWAKRLPLKQVVFDNSWQQPARWLQNQTMLPDEAGMATANPDTEPEQ